MGPFTCFLEILLIYPTQTTTLHVWDESHVIGRMPNAYHNRQRKGRGAGAKSASNDA